MQEGKGGPKTLRDYQQIATKTQKKPSRIASPQMEDEEEGEDCLPCSLVYSALYGSFSTSFHVNAN